MSLCTSACFVSILKQSRHGQPVLDKKSVRFSEPLVTDWWCPECNPTAPPQALSACTHYGHVVCINHLERIWFEKICCREYDQVFPLRDGSSLQVKRLQDDVILPKKATGDSAGYDLFSPVSVSIPAQSGVKIPLHISMAIPMGHYGRIASRSSLPAQRVHVAGGVIDRGYLGDVTVLLGNSRDQPFLIQKGGRIAQLILEKHSTPPVVEAKELSTTERGSGGFGSTGRERASDIPCLLLILKILIAFQKMFPQNCKEVKSTNKEHHKQDQSQNCDSILPNQSIVSKGGLHIDKRGIKYATEMVL